MNVSSLNYTNSYQGFSIKALTFKPFRSFLSLAPLGNYLTNFFLNNVISIYTKMLFELSGLPEYIGQFTKDESITLHKQFDKLLSWLELLNSQTSFFEANTKTKEFGEIVMLLTHKVTEIIYLLDEKIHSHYTFSITVNSQNNDWANAENDHWDNY